MTSIAIMQPVYLPWMGYFEQMAVCDEFMFLDDVQYTKKDWRNRNKIRTKTDWMWLTIPVQRAKFGQTLSETKISYSENWTAKHLADIRTNYAPCPYYQDIYDILAAAFTQQPVLLTDLTVSLTRQLAEYMGIHTPISFASDVPRVSPDRHDRIIELCRARNADLVYTGPAAKAYMDLDFLRNAGLEVIFQNYQHPHYKQHFPGFESHMAIIDLLMNHGPGAREILLSSPLPKRLSTTRCNDA